MQINKKPTSPIIKQTQEAKIRSRRRLIGSIFLLLIALFVLLNVTSHIKTDQSQINLVIEKKSAESNPIVIVDKIVGSVDDNTAIVDNNLQIVASESKIANESQQLTNLVTADVFESRSVSKPKKIIVKDDVRTKSNVANPLDILDGKMPEDAKEVKSIDNGTPKGKIYIQLAALSNKSNVLVLQKDLQQKGINTFIQEITTPKGIMYRLRLGPFIALQDAQLRLKELNNSGQSAIIATN